MRRLALSLGLAALAAGVLALPVAADAAPGYRVIGQPTLAGTTLGSRCPGAKARFNFRDDGFEMHGPAGIATDPAGPLFVADFGGRRVLRWADFDALGKCAEASDVIGAGDLEGPESVAFDPQTETLFVADTLSHTVKGYKKSGNTWKRTVMLGAEGVPGAGSNRFNFPRGLAVDAGGRLFVADDFNNRVMIFNPPIQSGESAADSIGAGNNGGFDSPKAIALSGDTLFVADYNKNRVLRFTGPFVTPNQVYSASGTFIGVGQPVDLAAHPDGSLLVTGQQARKIFRYKDAVWTPKGGPDSSFGDNMGPEPLGVGADREGRIYIADYRRYRVLIRDEFVKRTPVAAGASAKTKALLSDFRKRVNRNANRVASGQQLITWRYGKKTNPNAWYGDWLQMKQKKFALPLIMGGETSDLMSYPGFSPNQDALNELIRHGKAGDIVTLVWHPDPPIPNADFSKPFKTADLRDLVKDATAIGKRWQTELNRAADVLQKFENAGITVVFRPLHEQNGNFFWWGDDGSRGSAKRARQQAWVAMWRDLVNDFTKKKGLKNVLFVFGTNQVNYDQVVPPLTYYPGAAWADMVSIDIYDEELDLAGGQRGLRHYAALTGTGKPFGISEFGQSFNDNGTGPNADKWDARTLTKRIRDSYPRTVFAIAWYTSREGDPPKNFIFALPDVSFGKQMLSDPLIDTQ